MFLYTCSNEMAANQRIYYCNAITNGRRYAIKLFYYFIELLDQFTSKFLQIIRIFLERTVYPNKRGFNILVVLTLKSRISQSCIIFSIFT